MAYVNFIDVVLTKKEAIVVYVYDNIADIHTDFEKSRLVIRVKSNPVNANEAFEDCRDEHYGINVKIKVYIKAVDEAVFDLLNFCNIIVNTNYYNHTFLYDGNTAPVNIINNNVTDNTSVLKNKKKDFDNTVYETCN